VNQELFQVFENIESWQEFIRCRPELVTKVYIEDIVESARRDGAMSMFLGVIGPDQIAVEGTNYREALSARGLNSRCRAILELLTAEPWYSPDARIYAAEAVTPFALALRGRFPRFVGSEYVSSNGAREALFPIEFQDLTRLTHPSGRFDCVITNDCLEHVADVPACISELCRVLRVGGVMLSTFPFSFRAESVIKARQIGGQIEYLAEPEYHGNPAEPEKGSLVYQIPGWDILSVARAAGFARAEMVFVSSFKRAITGAEIAGIFVMRAYK
jgi:SAM-dependent methyltransferase